MQKDSARIANIRVQDENGITVDGQSSKRSYEKGGAFVSSMNGKADNNSDL